MPLAYTTLERAGIAIVALRLPVQILHGVAHSALRIHMAPWQNAYILLVITVLPLVSAFLLWRRRTHPLPRGGIDFISKTHPLPRGGIDFISRRVAFLLLFISMFGSLIFGGYYHFLAAGPDNVNELGDHAWAFPFQLSAVLLAVLEAEGTAIGIAGLKRTRAQS